MDITLLTELGLTGGVATTLATEVLKSKYIPIPATQHPRVTALIVSVLTSVYAVYQYNSANLVALPWQSWAALVVLTLLVSSFTYNNIIKGTVNAS